MNAHWRNITLEDKYTVDTGEVYLTGVQALVRLPLDLIRADRALGLDTAGYISGYRGSPLAGYDTQLTAAKTHLDAHDIVFQPGINEELAAVAVWGTQKVDRHPGACYRGVFGLWYGKAPGVDRCGDVFRHANASGTSSLGGVLAIAGDDPLAKSSSLPNQSEFAFLDAEIPVLSPCDIQELLDYGRHGIALSRYCGLWVGLIALADSMDASAVVNVDSSRLQMRLPDDHTDPRTKHQLNRLLHLSNRLDGERLTRELRLPAVRAYIRANQLNRLAFGSKQPRFGIIACGKAYRDLKQTFELMGLDQALAEKIGLAVYKLAMPWPLEPQGVKRFAIDCEQLLIVENKRALIETQIKDLLYHLPSDRRPSVWGKTKPDGRHLLSDIGELAPAALGEALLAFLPDGHLPEKMRDIINNLNRQDDFALSHAPDGQRSPFFCSGCPHNRSITAPEGARTNAGIGCHVMSELAGQSSDGFTMMGGEGVNWLGQFPFTTTEHAFANLGDGTYFHSGILAIRAALAAGAPITYKILYNDAVAMTGGQAVDGDLTVPRLIQQLRAEGVERIALLSEDHGHWKNHPTIPTDVLIRDRAEIMRVQKDYQNIHGVSVIVFDQTCAAEKRRRRKRQLYAPISRRILINERVCEGCGDCSQQSHCIAVEPRPTQFGLKRRINQSSCNADYACSTGFCPAFVAVTGAELRKSGLDLDFEALLLDVPTPQVAIPTSTFNLLLTGIGGMGVTTTAAIVAMAAHIDGLHASTLDMTGLAQKNGPVTSHIRLAADDHVIQGPRIPTGNLDVLLAADLIVAAGKESLSLCDDQRTTAVLNTGVAPTAEFTMTQKQSFNAEKGEELLAQTVHNHHRADFNRFSESLFGDSLYSNILLIGYAFQSGLLPISQRALLQAIALNRAACTTNRNAFFAGRLIAVKPESLEQGDDRSEEEADIDLATRIDFLANELTAYQDSDYAAEFVAYIAKISACDIKLGNLGRAQQLTRMAAEQLFRLMAYKDEYEVARLYTTDAFRKQITTTFSAAPKMHFYLAPPGLSSMDPTTGRPKKIRVGTWILPVFGMLARAKWLRGRWCDPFGHSKERKRERALIEEYRAMLDELLPNLTPENYELAVDIAASAALIRGYGPIKEANIAKATKLQDELLMRWQQPPPSMDEGSDHIVDAAQ